MQHTLTPKQQRFFDYLEDRINRSGRAPSLRQAADDLSISHAAVAQFIKALEEKGLIRRAGRYSRSITLLTEPGRPASCLRCRVVPVFGRIEAGLPLYAQKEWEESIIVDSEIYKVQNLFGLKINDDAMQDAGMLEGDIAICEPRQYGTNGEIVAVLIKGAEARIRRFFLRRDHIELQSENRAKNHPPARYKLGEVQVQGKVTGLFRGPGMC